MFEIRKAIAADIDAVDNIYNIIHDKIERGEYRMKWFRHLYPTRAWAEEHLAEGDLYVMTSPGDIIVATAVINHTPLPEYFKGSWYQPDNYDNILILHTLIVHADYMGQGLATRFMSFFEEMARSSGCNRVRLDTQAIDLPARNLYRKLGYREADRLPCEFKDIHDIDLVLIEKILN